MKTETTTPVPKEDAMQSTVTIPEFFDVEIAMDEHEIPVGAMLTDKRNKRVYYLLPNLKYKPLEECEQAVAPPCATQGLTYDEYEGLAARALKYLRSKYGIPDDYNDVHELISEFDDFLGCEP